VKRDVTHFGDLIVFSEQKVYIPGIVKFAPRVGILILCQIFTWG